MIKKISITLILIALTVSPAFALDVKYDDATGDIICIGNYPDMKPAQGEKIIQITGKIPRDIEQYTVKNNKFREKNNTEKEAMAQAKAQAKLESENAKKALLQKLNLQESDVPALISIMEDRTSE